MTTLKKILLLTLVCPSGAYAQIADAYISNDTLATDAATLTLANPALKPWGWEKSLSSISVGFTGERYNSAPVSYDGKGYGTAYFDAESYLKTSNSAITGHASYSNGTRFGISGCEVSDPELLYPYFTADTVGGNMRSECYNFGGSYSSSFSGGKWIYGAELHYIALLEYRQRDPRPKNTVGQLDFGASIGLKTGNYYLLAGGKAYKYSQSNSISFVSELGTVKIFHLTGPGFQYNRFAGSNRDVNFSGWSRGVSLTLWPASEGAFASASYDCVTLRKILKNLNNLPINRLTDNVVKAEIGWKTHTNTFSANLTYDHRNGVENIFGDPAGNVYPELFSLSTFSRHYLSGGVKYFQTLSVGKGKLSILADITYQSLKEEYKGSNTPFTAKTESLVPSIDLRWARQIGKKVLIGLTADVFDRIPLSHTISERTTTDYFKQLADEDYRVRASHSFNAGIAGDLLYLISVKYAVGVRLGYTYKDLRASINGNAYNAALTFKF